MVQNEKIGSLIRMLLCTAGTIVCIFMIIWCTAIQNPKDITQVGASGLNKGDYVKARIINVVSTGTYKGKTVYNTNIPGFGRIAIVTDDKKTQESLNTIKNAGLFDGSPYLEGTFRVKALEDIATKLDTINSVDQKALKDSNAITVKGLILEPVTFVPSTVVLIALYIGALVLGITTLEALVRLFRKKSSNQPPDAPLAPSNQQPPYQT